MDKAFIWKLNNFALSVILLTIGTLIYLIKREDSLLVFNWLREFNLDIYIDFIRHKFSNLEMLNSNFVIYSLPGGLWMMSFALFFNIVWKIEDIQKYIWMFFAMLPAVGSEILQYLGMISGTFDMLDLLAYLTGYLIIVVYVYTFEKIFSNKN